MRPNTMSAGRLAVALLSLTSAVMASDNNLWPRWLPDADGLLVGRATSDSTSNSIPTSATTNLNTPSGSGSSSGTTKTTGKTTAKTTSKSSSNSTTTKTFASTDSTGSVVMITPTSTSTTLIRVGEFVTFAWNYTNLKGTPSGIDVAVSCSLASSTWLLTQNMSFATAGRYTWDTAAFQTANIENPLPYDYYTLQIYDAAAGVSETASPGYLAPFTAGATFGFYTGQPYTPIGEWVCATCSGAMSPMEKRFLGGAVAMSFLTVLTFTWFVTGVGAFI